MVVAVEKWLLFRGGRQLRFDCILGPLYYLLVRAPFQEYFNPFQLNLGLINVDILHIQSFICRKA